METPRQMFLIQILNDENLRSPNYITVKVLQEIKKANCDLIIIIIQDGYSVKHFLNFIHENRILNTKANYIMLHDYRILNSEMLHIWNKILSCVLIKKIERDRKFENMSTWFELLTVPYPNIILRETFYGKLLNRWKYGKMQRRNVNFFNDKTTNLQGVRLKTAMYEHFPMVIKTSNSKPYKGIEYNILNAIQKKMNFKMKIYETSDSKIEKWGRQLPNESFTGLAGEIVYGRAHFVIGNLYANLFNLKIMDFSIAHSIECLTFLTPESSTDNSWKTLFAPFSGEMWACVISSQILIGLIFYYLKAQSAFLKDTFDDLSNCFLLTYSMLLLVSLSKMPKSWSLRVLAGWYWTYCLLIACTYRASFTAILANPPSRITVDSVRELSESGIKCGALGFNNKILFQDSFDEYVQKIGNYLEHVETTEGVTLRILKGDFAYFDNGYFLRYLRSNTKNEKTEKENLNADALHIMKSCVYKMPVSIGMEKNSPLKPRVDKYIRRLMEGGLLTKWLKEVIEDLPVEAEAPQEALMDLNKFWSSFVVLGIGYFLAFLALIYEHLHFKYIVQKHPLYDKFNPKKYYNFVRGKKQASNKRY
ncbi:glutamate receptor ionotropic, kainate glr-3 [Condylostylus longicornis]|uniref:glutamate receptor ionotropic, kainate glr-3 n=1 Tax=Condylostylus longicornis TaxID=2530218 RepID=UPI00244DAE25|nr:glutamate receptor ionotropic, kainate glr-3 [Condylostylus longicornis]